MQLTWIHILAYAGIGMIMLYVWAWHEEHRKIDTQFFIPLTIRDAFAVFFIYTLWPVAFLILLFLNIGMLVGKTVRHFTPYQ